MSIKICREAYQKMIDGDIEWLLRQPRDLERDHIEAVLRKSVELLYGKEIDNEQSKRQRVTSRSC